MAFEGGALNVIGITPSFLSSLGTQTAQNGTIQGLGQVWQGAGQSFYGSAGQSLAGNLAGSAVNVALNSALGTQVAGPQGLKLTSGANLLASTITPYVTSQVAAGINQSIQKSLKSAGPFGPALSTLGTGLVNQATQGLTNAIFGATNQGVGRGNANNYIMFPGGGGEPDADYQGYSYSISKDVVFSLVPANRGPQQFGLAQATNDPKTQTTVSANVATTSNGAAYAATNSDVNYLKEQAMKVDLNATIKPFDVNETIGGGSGDPLGVLRGTKWDDLPQFTRDPIRPTPRPQPLF